MSHPTYIEMLQDLNKSFPPRTSHTKTLVKDSILFDYIKSRPYLTTPNSYCEDFEISNVNLKKFISPKVFAKIQYDSFEITISIHQRPGEKTIKVKISSDSNNSNGVYMLGHCIRCYDGTLDYDTVREFLLRTIAMASCQSAESSVSAFYGISIKQETSNVFTRSEACILTNLCDGAITLDVYFQTPQKSWNKNVVAIEMMKFVEKLKQLGLVHTQLSLDKFVLKDEKSLCVFVYDIVGKPFNRIQYETDKSCIAKILCGVFAVDNNTLEKPSDCWDFVWNFIKKEFLDALL